MRRYLAEASGRAKSTSALSAKPLHGTAMAQASTQRRRYRRSSSGILAKRSSTPISILFSTKPSMVTIQGRISSAWAFFQMVFEEPNS